VKLRESANEDAMRRAREEAEAHARQQLEVGVAALPCVHCRCRAVPRFAANGAGSAELDFLCG
jgi:hypothetical protein